MRIKTHLSIEERRAAIQKEIEAITVDIERVRSLVIHDQPPAAVGETQHAQQGQLPAPPRSAAGLN